jgi:hypothetical protein
MSGYGGVGGDGGRSGLVGGKWHDGDGRGGFEEEVMIEYNGKEEW